MNHKLVNHYSLGVRKISRIAFAVSEVISMVYLFSFVAPQVTHVPVGLYICPVAI